MRKMNRLSVRIAGPTLTLIVALTFTTHGYADDWSIELAGARNDTLDRADVVAARSHPSHSVERRLEKKGATHTYRGIPLWLVVAVVDGEDDRHAYTFDRELWESGYDITLEAADGYAVTFSTADVPADELVLAEMVDGTETAPRIVGDVSSKLWVKELVRIELGIEPPAAAEDSGPPDFELALTLNERQYRFSLQELEASPYFTEGKGSFTTSAGSTYTNTYSGVKFAEFVNAYVKLEPGVPVTVVAMDGYEMTYDATDLLDESDGVWILAFKRDGEYLPKDPGYVRSVKIGPSVPDIAGHSSVKMISELRVSGERYRDFTLAMRGKMSVDVDRQTLQSGVSCHRRTVVYHSRRSGTDTEYTGIPLWLLVAFADDPRYAPHRQDSSIVSYSQEALAEGYTVVIEAADGFSVRLASEHVDRNDDVIIAMYSEGRELPDDEWPLIIVWDKDAAVVPDGIKAVRNITTIRLVFDE